MKQLIYLAVLALIPVSVFAQQSFDDDVNTELDKMYQNQNRASAPQVQVNVQQAPAAQQAPAQQATVAQATAQTTSAPTAAQPAPAKEAVQTQSQTTNVVTAAPAAPAAQAVQAQAVQTQTAPKAAGEPTIQIQKESTTVIEAAPLTESKADKLRKARQETEVQTEQKLVEKLETSRMEDEKRRAEVLFGDKFTQLQTPPPAQQPQQAVVAAPVVVQQQSPQPVPVVLPEQQVVAPPVAKEEAAGVSEEKIKEEPVKKENKTYMSLLGGIGEYNNSNIQGQYALGIGIGKRINDRFLLEGQFNYSDFHIQEYSGGAINPFTGTFYPRIVNMAQYEGLFEAKYELLGGTFRPLVGAAAAYTYRTYNDIQFGNPGDTGSSNALDFGILAGADFNISESFSLGFEVLYLWNLANQETINNSYQTFNGNSGIPTPENMGNMNTSLVGRITF